MKVLPTIHQRSPLSRILLSGFLALLVTGATPSQAEENEAPDRAPVITGSWLQTINQEGGPTQALATFSEGGALVLTINAPGSFQTTFHGTWVRKGSYEFAWTAFSFGYDPSGNHVVTVRVHDELTLARDGQSYSATGKVDLLDPDLNLITPLPPSTVQAIRIKPD